VVRVMRHIERNLGHLRRLEAITKASRVHLSQLNERRLLEAIRDYLATAKHKPPWYRDIRLATPAEDHLGIDLVILTDGLDLFLQVKTSDRGRRVFEDHGRKMWHRGERVPITGVIVVNDHRSDKQIIGEALSVMGRVRKSVLSIGSNFMPRPTRPVADAPPPEVEPE
jgi:hypothetical protein